MLTIQPEPTKSLRELDHVWVDVEVPPLGKVRATIPTQSRKNLMAKFEPRVRVGILSSPPMPLPAAGVAQMEWSDYADWECLFPISFELFERRALQELLMQKAAGAALVSIAGNLYARDHMGIHEIHSRRASCAVPQDVRGKDGWIRFHHGLEAPTETFLLKFCGQA